MKRPDTAIQRGGPKTLIRRALGLVIAAILGCVGYATPAFSAPGDPGLVDLARFGTATATRDGDTGFEPDKAIDGDDVNTRWGSGTDNDLDPLGAGEEVVWQVDLGQQFPLDSAKLMWESGAKVYTVDISTDGNTWTSVETVNDGGLRDVKTVDLSQAQARYLRIVMTEQVPNDWEILYGDGHTIHYYGYSLYTVEVWGESDTSFVGFASAASQVNAGQSVTVPVALSMATSEDVTVHAATSNGTAIADTDYTAFDQDITIPAGQTTADITIPTVESSEGGTFNITLSDPSNNVALGSRTTHTVTIKKLLPAGDQVPSTNRWTTFVNFEDGWPGQTYGSGESGTPTLSSVPSDRPDAPNGSQALQAAVDSSDAAGIYWNFDAPQNWRDYNAASIWFKGGGTTKDDLFFEIKTGPSESQATWTTYQWHFADTADWQRLVFDFNAPTKIEGANAENLPTLNPTQVRAVSLSLGWWGNHTAIIDDIELRENSGVVEDFDNDPHLTTDAAGEPGIYSWANPGGNYPTTAITEDDRAGAAAADNKVLSGTYHVQSGGWGGVTQNFAQAQDWSQYGGIRLWWYASQENNPASPTAGPDIRFEVRTGRDSGLTAALHDTTFKDNWGSSTSRWKLVEIPFSAMVARTDYQQVWEDVPVHPDLSRAWGYSVTFPAGSDETGWKIDQIEVYGAPSRPDDVSVSVDPNVVLVDNGESAEIGVTATTVDGQPLTSDVDVAVATVDDTAVAGTDYTAVNETVHFDAGSESGSRATVTVSTLPVSQASIAKSFNIELQPSTGEATGQGRVVINAHGFPYLDENLSDDQRAADLLSRMTLEEKIGQMAQAERSALKSDSIAGLGLGSVLSGGGSVPTNNTPAGWADMIDGYQRQALSTRLQIPIIYGVDAVHGHSNVVGATILPHNIGLGSTRDPEVIRAGMQVTAQEVRATGIPWTFAPTVAVTRDERWGRSYESFGEDPAVVSLYARAAVEGLQGTDPSNMRGANTVLATAKHWAGDGGTEYGSGNGAYRIDQGITKADSMADFLALHASVYEPAIEAGVGSIMPSYSAVQIGDEDPIRMHVHKELNTDVLKGELGFDGFLISDWEGIDKVASLPVEKGGYGGVSGSYKMAAINSVNAGMDMMMSPYNFETFINAIREGVADNEVSQDRIDDAVTRILKQKFALGLFEQPFAERENVDNVGSDANRAVAREAAAKSQVLLKNSGALPLSQEQSIYVAGSTADDLGRQMGGWTITWQGGSGQTTQGTSIGQAIKAVGGDNVTIGSGTSAPSQSYDVGVVIVGERPYAEGEGDIGNPSDLSLELSAADKQTIDNVRSKVDQLVVLVVSGRPQVIDEAQLADIDALVASWLPGSEGDGVADVLFGKESFSGSLSVTWPAEASQVPINVGDENYAPAFPFGWGLRTDSAKQRLTSLQGELPAGAEAKLAQILANDSLWNADGSLADDTTGLPQIQQLLAVLTGVDNVAAASTVASIARDIAAAHYTPADAAQFAQAELDVVSGKANEAIIDMAQIAGITLDPADSQPSTNANASAIFVNGSPVAGFDPAKTQYSVQLDAAQPLPVVSAQAQDITATVAIADALAVPGSAKIVVTAADGQTTKTYTVSFTLRATPPKSTFTSKGSVKIAGKKQFKSTLKANTTAPKPAASKVTYQWIRNGKAIVGATKRTYTITKADIGKKLSVRVTFSKSGYSDQVTDSAVVKAVKAKTRTVVKKATARGSQAVILIRVKSAAVKKPKGKVVVQVGKTKKTVKLKAKARGKATVKLSLRQAGKFKVRVSYQGNKVLAGSKAKKTPTVRLR